jgi:hypothetical protein
MTVLHKPKPLTATPTPTDWVVEDIPAGTFRVNRAALVDEADRCRGPEPHLGRGLRHCHLG